MMSHDALVFAHLIGVVLLGGAIFDALFGDHRVRRARSIEQLDDALRGIERSGQWLLAPGVVLLLASGAWLVAREYGGWHFVEVPWLAGMVLLYALESARGATLTRRHATRLRRAVDEAPARARVPAEVDRLRRDPAAILGRFLEATLFVLIVALGVFRPQSWAMFWVGAVAALVAAALAAYVVTSGAPATSSSSRASVDGDGLSPSVAASTSRQRW